MKRVSRFGSLILAFALASAAAGGSTLVVGVEHHTAVTNAAGQQRVLRTAFTDDPIVATVKLDVYALPQLPSTRKHLEALQSLSADTWVERLRWDVRDAISGDAVDVHPRVMSSSLRDRGPSAESPSDRDTSVPCSSYEARFDLGALPPGDYTVRVAVEGLESAAFPLAVRAGTEPEVRDVYLQKRARKATAWSEFERLQLERLRLDPTKAAALVELAERALVDGSLEEATLYFSRAADVMEANLERWAQVNPEDAKRQEPGVRRQVTQMRRLRDVLPEYFAHRPEWAIAIDPQTGGYVIRSRPSGNVIREIVSP
ncbi:MAG: hypothetical protein ACRD2J_03335 [Thermoanaerobaculia bacterium]